jgi:hypothetical protein
MGLIHPPKYKKKNPLTGLWEWVLPPPEQYNKKDEFKKINVKTKKKRR